MSVTPPLREVVRHMRQALPKHQERTREPKPSKRRRHTGASPEVLDLVRARCGGRCERCAEPLDGGDPHHRIPRGMGGSRDPKLNAPSAIVAICRACHDFIESYRADAYDTGWLVKRRQNTTFISVHSLLYGIARLRDDEEPPDQVGSGRYEQCQGCPRLVDLACAVGSAGDGPYHPVCVPAAPIEGAAP